MDTSGMERSFKFLGDSITKMFGAQQTLNQTMQHQLARSSIAQGKQTDALKEFSTDLPAEGLLIGYTIQFQYIMERTRGCVRYGSKN